MYIITALCHHSIPTSSLALHKHTSTTMQQTAGTHTHTESVKRSRPTVHLGVKWRERRGNEVGDSFERKRHAADTQNQARKHRQNDHYAHHSTNNLGKRNYEDTQAETYAHTQLLMCIFVHDATVWRICVWRRCWAARTGPLWPPVQHQSSPPRWGVDQRLCCSFPLC